MKIKFTYFKDTGKFYASGEIETGPDHAAFPFLSDCIYPREIGRKMNYYRKLPGLQNGYWEGPFVVETYYPELVLP